MNGTVIDIPGITTSVVALDLQYSTDQVHTIVIKDHYGQKVEIKIAFGKITSAEALIES